jgi:hypothetical protein
VAITLQSDNPTSDSLWRSNISAESEKKWKSFVTKCWGFFSGTIPTFLSILKWNGMQFWCERAISMRDLLIGDTMPTFQEDLQDD